MFSFKKPEISVVVVMHRMRREAPRTLYSLSTAYQQGVAADDYEVLVVENASDQMLTAAEVQGYGRQFRYFVNPGNSSSPASAINFGARQARGRKLMLMVDGARILSPGILRHTLTACRLYDAPVVATLAWHLGPDNQARSIHQGYCQDVEDRLLANSGWETDGYHLFTISALAGSCAHSWFFPILESNCVTLSRRHFRALGGYCEQFQTVGGGFVNLDFYDRAVADPRRPLVLLLGEGTFHQFHGGVATNRRDDEPILKFQDEYQRLRGKAFTPPVTSPIYFGNMPEAAKPYMRSSVRRAEILYRSQYPSLAPEPKEAFAAAVAAPRPDFKPRPRVVTILGMHRSGTSCLAGTLMECGVDFGEVSRKNNFNFKGNNESQQIMELHDRLLADNGGSWKEPPEEVRWQASHRQLRDAIIEQFQQQQSTTWGFKDPRTLLTRDGWSEALPEAGLVGIFRHPEAVAQSLTHRNLFSREKGLDLWCYYNQRLLAMYQERPFPILYFSEDPAEVSKQLGQLVKFLGLSVPAGGCQFYEPSLQHFTPAEEKDLPNEVARMYRQLHEIAWDPGGNSERISASDPAQDTRRFAEQVKAA